MRVLIIGATGTLGRQVARCCLDQGHDVRCMVRRPRRAGFLQEWGAELVRGDLLEPASLDYALADCDAVIDAATARVDDEQSVYTIDWDGKLNLFRRMEAAGVRRLVFHSILAAGTFRTVPLMDIKYCTEDALQHSDLDFTILQPAGFMQGLIGQYAIPVLDQQTVWVNTDSSSVAYMNSQDVASFTVAALNRPETCKRAFPVVGPKAWSSSEVVQLCERFSQKQARVLRVAPPLLAFIQGTVRFFEAGLNVADRLAFSRVASSGRRLDAPMDESYNAFGVEPASITTLEHYISDYYRTITRRLRDMEVDMSKEEKKRLPF